MNKQRAKELLSAYLKDSSSEADPEIQRALELAESDPELIEWMQLQTEMDPALRDALSDIPVPKDLEARLLETVREDEKVAGSRSPARRLRLVGWGIAATLLVSVSTFWLLRENESIVQNLQHSVSGVSPDDFSHFRDGMAYYINDVYFRLDHTTQDLDSIRSWLSSKQSPVYEDLPDALTNLDPIGCKQLQWQGLDVSLVCFHTADGRIVHLFLLDRDNATDNQFSGIDAVARSSGLETAGWVSSSTVYLLVGSDPSVDIEFALG
ncbi:MAG: hypothetical protein AB3N64_07335 [Puniceicoccaceae bacterium]